MNKKQKIENIIKCRKQIDLLIREKYYKLSKKYDLSLEQFQLLIEIDELTVNIAPTVGEIAKNINNSPNTVSERITRLENKGLVEKIRDKKDRRISRVFLTESGKKLIEDMDKESSGTFLFDFLHGMKEEDINNLLKCLKSLVEKMSKSKL
ncbi:hypothetical protein NL50_14200 [Clostridium acetobutylicum]|nr:hypothetical protein NL50_14200 [Clostridium acetobutylicum]